MVAAENWCRRQIRSSVRVQSKGKPQTMYQERPLSLPLCVILRRGQPYDQSYRKKKLNVQKASRIGMLAKCVAPIHSAETTCSIFCPTSTSTSNPPPNSECHSPTSSPCWTTLAPSSPSISLSFRARCLLALLSRRRRTGRVLVKVWQRQYRSTNSARGARIPRIGETVWGFGLLKINSKSFVFYRFDVFF